ncbi:unnamed protein product [Sphagnum balticum]
MRQTIAPGQTAYDPNTTGGGCPFQSGMKAGALYLILKRSKVLKWQAKRCGSSKEAPAALFVNESYMHCKAIAASGDGVSFVQNSLQRGGLPSALPESYDRS